MNQAARDQGFRFSLAALWEYVTICAILAGLTSLTGSIASVCLMVMAAGLALKLGLVALFSFVPACLLAGVGPGYKDDNVFLSQMPVVAIGFVLSIWFSRGKTGAA